MLHNHNQLSASCISSLVQQLFHRPIKLLSVKILPQIFAILDECWAMEKMPHIVGFDVLCSNMGGVFLAPLHNRMTRGEETAWAMMVQINERGHEFMIIAL